VRAPRKIVCLESYWNDGLAENFSVKGFLEAMAPLDLAFHGRPAAAEEFVKSTGVRAAIGYATPVPWMASLVCDLLFLHRFYADPAPWKNLRRIFRSVHRDYPVARRLGHLLVTSG
jgi:hypothetical protein